MAGEGEAMRLAMTQILERHKAQFSERFGMEIYLSTLMSFTVITGNASGISNKHGNDEEADIYVKMCARFLIDMIDSDPTK